MTFMRIRLEALFTVLEAYASHAKDWDALPDDEWVQRLTAEPVFVAIQKGDPFGIKGLARQRPSKMAHRASIVMVYVRESARRSGLAAAPLERLIAHALEIDVSQLELSANAENAQAIRFYTWEGYSVIGRIPGGYLHDGRKFDEVLMAKQVA